jgi:hypothetical protein
MGEGAGLGNAALAKRGAVLVDDIADLMAMHGQPVSLARRDQAAVTGTQLGFDLPL